MGFTITKRCLTILISEIWHFSEKEKVMDRWRPIETAPKDGRKVLVSTSNPDARGDWPQIVEWLHRDPVGNFQEVMNPGSPSETMDLDEGVWCTVEEDRWGIFPNAEELWDEPTHWMPITVPPREENEVQELKHDYPPLPYDFRVGDNVWVKADRAEWQCFDQTTRKRKPDLDVHISNANPMLIGALRKFFD